MNRSHTHAAPEAARTLGEAFLASGRIFGDAFVEIARLTAEFRRWRRARRTRRSLDHLDDRMLADIGLSRGEVMTLTFIRRDG